MAIGFGAVGGAGSHRVLGLFLRTDSTIARADLGGPRGHVSLFNPTIPIPPKVGEIWRPFPTFANPVPTLLLTRASPG